MCLHSVQLQITIHFAAIQLKINACEKLPPLGYTQLKKSNYYCNHNKTKGLISFIHDRVLYVKKELTNSYISLIVESTVRIPYDPQQIRTIVFNTLNNM